MECAGKIRDVSRDLTTNKILVLLEIQGVTVQEVLKLKNLAKLAVRLVKFRNKRSNDANSYAWVLMSEIAYAVRVDKWTVYLDMLQQYGVFTHVIVKPEAVERIKQEWRATVELGPVKVNGDEGIQLQCYYGSSTYDTKEMSRFIDGIVSEAEKYDIDTRTPDEICRMKQEWGV